MVVMPEAEAGRLLLERHEPIAIIGVGLRFPGGNDTLDGLEEFLREGRSGIRPVPPDRWDVAAFTPEEPGQKGKIHTAGCGFLDGIDQFDAPFFSVSPLQAQYTDPQQRLLLETAWEALENANLSPAALRHGHGGVFIGASSFDYALEMDSISYPDTDGHLASGITPFAMSGRLSYFLGWRGPSLTTDTACASSLTALHLAVTGLRRRECDVALAGAVNAIHHPKILVMFSHAGMLAPDGRCKTFDEAADGYARAEGCGVLVLKRLSDAQRDADTVLALVRGTAIGQNGESAGLTVPNGTAQEAVLRAAIADARLEPRDIQYVEAHGTGTPLGDPIEMGALSSVFMDSHAKAEPLVVASLKTNLGHMEAAAGIGGVVKTILQMRAGMIFPHLNFRTPSGRIPWDAIPVTVPVECMPWQAPTRRAVVSSFGFTGAIACAVIEEAPAASPVASAGGAAGDLAAEGGYVFTLSAKSKRSLRMLAGRYQEFLDSHPEAEARDVCYTASIGRSHFPIRRAGVIRDRGGLAALLGRWRDEPEPAAEAGSAAAGRADVRKIAFLFAGQGSQYPGMGAALYRQFPAFRDQVDACDELFAGPLDRSIREIMLGAEGAGYGDEAAIDQTRYTQPALFILEYALAKLWMSWGVRPNVMIGHSIGEVAAAAVAGLFSLEDAVTLVAARARLMQMTAPGGMAAVSAPAEEITPLLTPYADLSLAALNSPGQCVVSGAVDSLTAVTAALRERGLTVKRLAVSHAFHSPLMAEVSAAFREALAAIQFREPSLTLISNLTGRVARPSEISSPDYWVRHIAEPVNFAAGMAAVDRRGKHACIEIGPSRALTAIARQCVAPQDHRWLATLDRKDADGTVIRESVAELYRAGLPFSWAGFHAGREGRKIVLPAYAFDRKRYWLPLKGKRHGLGGTDAAADGRVCHPLLGEETTTPQQRAAGVREFATRLSAARPAYLASHTVLGQVVFPGTGYLETILALQDAVHGDTRRPVTDLRIREPLLLARDEPTEVRTRLTEAEGSIEIFSRAPSPDGTGDGGTGDGGTIDGGTVERIHVTAVLGAREAGDALTEAGQCLTATQLTVGEPAETLGRDEIYAAYEAAGLQYGPEFRRMRQVIRYGTGFAVGELDGLDAGPVGHVPPALLDAATHAFAAVGDDGESYLPVRYGWFRLFRKPRARSLQVLLRIDPDCRAGFDISLDLLALEEGQPVFELRGLGLRRVAGSPRGRRGIASAVRWVRCSLPGLPEPGPRQVLAVHCGPAIADSLAQVAPDTAATAFALGPADVAAALRAGGVTELCWFWDSGTAEASLAGGDAVADAGAGLAELRAECERNYRDLLELLAVLRDEGFGRGQRLWLVTERAQWLPGDPGGGTAAAATLWGFGHSLLNEYPSYRATMIDLPGGEAGLRHLAEEWDARGSGEFQIAYRDGQRRVRRLIPLDLPARQDANLALAIREYGQFSGISAAPAEDVAPRGDEIQVSVRAAGLNFKDVLNALGMLREFGDQPLGFEAAGTVAAAAPDASHRVGDEVIVNYLGCMKRRVTVPSAVAVRRPPNVGPLEAAGLMSVYVTAYYALHTLAGMKAGDRVLIHAAAGGVGQAAVHLAQAAGAEVFATASPHKWPLLRSQGVRHIMSSRTLTFADEIADATGGEGVDIVLNSLSKDYIPAGMRSLARGGRFIEMGKVGAWTPEQARAERPDVAYHTFDLSELPLDQAIGVNAGIMRIIAGRVAAGELPAIRCTAYSLDEIEEAFGVLSRGANLGKLVLDFAAQQQVGRDAVIDPDRTYLITGGLGGLGLMTAAKLADLGARHIALLGRGSTPAADVAPLAARLRDRAEVTVCQGDVADPGDVHRVLASLQGGPHPVAGIIHAAGSLADSPVADQTWESIDAVFRAKVYGSWLLARAARSLPDLDLLVGYSSAASVVGAPGQSNYAAGNAFLDDLMLRQAGQGLPALSVNWGPWGGAGMSARLDAQVLRRWRDEGIGLLTPKAALRALVSFLELPPTRPGQRATQPGQMATRAGQRVTQAVVGEYDWAAFAAAKPVQNAVYQRLAGGAGAAADGIDVAALIAAPKQDRIAAIEALVRTKVAAVLHFDGPEAVDSSTEFVQLGLDSLVAVELKNVLEAALRLPLPPTLALDHPSATLLSEFLEQQLVPEPAA